jgi:type I restriction enzyme S subunit
MHAGLPYVGLEDIESDTGRLLGTLEARAVQSSTFRFTPQHVLYGRLRPYLNKVLAPEFDGHCSTEIIPLLPLSGVLRSYLFYWLTAPATVSALDATSTGARMPRANLEAALELPFPLPDVDEQRRIVAILHEAFERIATAKAHAEKNLRNAREVFAQRREETLEQSDGWRDAPLSEICEIRHGYAFEGEHFATHGEHVLLTPGSFFETGGFRDRGEKTKYFVGEIPPAFALDEGDLLVAMTEQAAGLLGSPLLVPEGGRYLHNQRLGRVIGRDSVPWTNEFFFHVFNLRRVRAEIHASASGVKVRHTSPAKIGAVRVRFPPTTGEQSAVAAALVDLAEDCHRLEASYTRKLAALDELKQSLLHQAFSGQL